MIGENIKRIRESRGISQSEFAEMLHIKRQTLFKYEKNIITNIPIERVSQMATILGCDPSELTGWTKSEKAVHDRLLKLIEKLDDTDRAKLEERADMMLEADKYQED